jgi:CheY-like chemotaxis protein
MGAMTKILLVEDSKFMRLATERALTRAGYEISTSADGKDVLELAREKAPDLILLDMLLPHMTGPEVLKALKKDPDTKAIPVVVLSGLSEKNAARLREDGAFAFLEKSALALDKGTSELLTAVAEIIEQLNSGANTYVPVKARRTAASAIS